MTTISELRQNAREIWEAALEHADPGLCVRRNLAWNDGVLFAAGKEFRVSGRLIVIGAGKAVARMAQAVEEIVGDRIDNGLVVTKFGHSLPLNKIEIVEAGHPIPDGLGVRAVHRIRKLVTGLTPDDVVLCLLTGGASALWPAPAEGIALDQMQDLTSLLLRAGATIRELNAVRKHLSLIKGGQLARWASPARIISLIVSDVIGDPLDFIASGPTAPDTTSFSDALGIIQKYSLKVADSILDRFERGVHGDLPETPKAGDPVFKNVDNVIIANSRILIEAAREKAVALNRNTMILGTEIEGEARDVARFFAAISREIGNTGNPLRMPACVVAGGETTVTVRGQGLGGRNQEMALAWAIAMASRPSNVPCCFASVASDGADGPTNAAGGLVDPFTCARAAEMGLVPMKFLRANDSSNFLKATGDRIVTGPTQTNLMDLQILLVG